MIMQNRTGDTVLVKNREMTGRRKDSNTAVVAGRRRGEDDKKHNTFAPLHFPNQSPYLKTF
jgi:hypothetical protein